jgi:hypothetical protein
MLGFNRLRLYLSARVGAVNHDFPIKGSARYAECAVEDQSWPTLHQRAGRAPTLDRRTTEPIAMASTGARSADGDDKNFGRQSRFQKGNVK